jgi:hypothetical protein
MEMVRSSPRLWVVMAIALLGSSPSAAKPAETEHELAELQRKVSFTLFVEDEEARFDLSEWMRTNGSGGFPQNYSDEEPRIDLFEVRPVE